MRIPDHILVRRKHKLSEEEIAELNSWVETKALASKRMRDANRRYQEANAIFEGLMAKKKWDLGWSGADNIIFDDEEGELLDLIPGVDDEGRCLNCHEIHDPDDSHD